MTLSSTSAQSKKRGRSSLADDSSTGLPSPTMDTINIDVLSSKSHQTSLFSFFSKAPKIRKATPSPKEKVKGSHSDDNDVDNSVETASSLAQHKSTSDVAIAQSAVKRESYEMHPPHNSKPATKLTQVYIDCGQKQFGQVLCNNCGMLYMPGVPEDERQHRQLCQAYVKGIACMNGTVVGGKVVERHNKKRQYIIAQWKPSGQSKHCPSQWPLLAQMIAKDLGMDESTALGHLTTQTVFLYLGSVAGNKNSNNKHPNHILGAVTIQSIAKAYRMSSLHDRSLTSTKAMLGVGMLWTHPVARKTGIATTLVNAARNHAVFGMQVPKSMLAFSSPTQAGYDFALQYLNGEENRDDRSNKKNEAEISPLVYEM